MARGAKHQNRKKRDKAKETSPTPISPVYREPSGKKQRPSKDDVAPAVARKNRATVVNARMRHNGLSEQLANQPEARWWLGTLYLRGRIPWRVHEAIDRYATIKRNMSKVCQTPRVRSGSVLDGFGGFDGADGDDPHYVEWVARVRQQYRECRHALATCKDNLAAMMVDAAIDGENLGDWLDTICAGGHALADMMNLPEDKPKKKDVA